MRIKQERIDPEGLELVDRVICINRVMLVRAGGKTTSFNAMVAVGDGNGIVGIGFGKSREIPEAIRKAIEDAKKNLIRIPLMGTTIPHEVTGHFCASTVFLKPAAPGTGVIAGSAVKVILEVAGVKDVLSKCYGSRNKINVARATMEALKQLQSPEEVARLRERPVEYILERMRILGGLRYVSPRT